MFTNALYFHIYDAVCNGGIDTFYCGMQVGMDIWAAMAALKLKADLKDASHIRLIGVSPFRGEENRRSDGDKKDYFYVRDRCDDFIVLSEHFYKNCYLARDEYMVKRSSLVIAAVAELKSGTGYTMKKAKERKLKLDVIDLNLMAARVRKEEERIRLNLEREDPLPLPQLKPKDPLL